MYKNNNYALASKDPVSRKMDKESTAFVAVNIKFSARNQTKPKLDYSC